MIDNDFSLQAKKAASLTEEGLDHLIEAHELQMALLNHPKDSSYATMVQEIIEKEKLAVALIQKSTLVQRDLMNRQHASVQKLIEGI